MRMFSSVALSVSVLAMVFTLGIFGADAQYRVLDETQQEALRKCRDQYAQALLAYKNAQQDKVAEFLEAAAESAKAVDIKLAGLISQLKAEFEEKAILSVAISGQIAIIFNVYNKKYNLGYPMFNPGNPVLADPQWKSKSAD